MQDPLLTSRYKTILFILCPSFSELCLRLCVVWCMGFRYQHFMISYFGNTSGLILPADHTHPCVFLFPPATVWKAHLLWTLYPLLVFYSCYFGKNGASFYAYLFVSSSPLSTCQLTFASGLFASIILNKHSVKMYYCKAVPEMHEVPYSSFHL